MESYSIFRDLAIIIIFAKVFGIIARKCKAPQVVNSIKLKKARQSELKSLVLKLEASLLLTRFF